MNLMSAIRNPTVALNVAAPLAAYYGLHAAGATDLVALSVSAVFPLVAVGLTAARSRRVDALGLVSIIAIVIGVASAVLVRDARLVLVMSSLPAPAVGLAFLGSVLGARSMIEQMAGRLGRRADSDPALRRRFRQLTTVWGLALVATGILHITLALTLTVSLVPMLSLVGTVLILGPVALWTVRLRARARHHRVDQGVKVAPAAG